VIVQHHPVWTGTHSSTQTSWALPTRKSRVHVAHEAPPGASLGTPAEAPRHAVVRRLRKDSEETFFYFSIMVVKLRLTYSNGLPISIFGCWGTLHPSDRGGETFRCVSPPPLPFARLSSSLSVSA
jgi:hypothetical protein